MPLARGPKGNSRLERLSGVPAVVLERLDVDGGALPDEPVRRGNHEPRTGAHLRSPDGVTRATGRVRGLASSTPQPTTRRDGKALRTGLAGRGERGR
jgi:hypothetical protein